MHAVLFLFLATLAAPSADEPVTRPRIAPPDGGDWQPIAPAAWRHRRTGAKTEARLVPYADADPDTALDKILGDMREAGAVSDDMRFIPQGTIVGWISADGATRLRVCARGFPETDGPFTMILTGSWPSKRHAAARVAFDRFCNDAVQDRK